MFNDIKETLFSTLDIAQKKGEELARLSSLRIEAIKLSKKISNEYKNLGMLVYECRMSNIDDTETIECCVKTIADLRRQLTLLNREIDLLSKTARCDYCSHKNKKQDTTCEKCGEPLNDTPEDDIDAIKNEIAEIRQNIKDLTEN